MSILSRDKKPGLPRINSVSRTEQKHQLGKRADERTALEFSMIMQRRAGMNKGDQDATASNASETESRLKASASNVLSELPTSFLQTGRSFSAVEGSESPDGGYAQQHGVGQRIERSQVANVLCLEASDKTATKNVIDVVYKEWIQGAREAKCQRWDVQLTSSGNVTSSLAIECNERGDWTVRFGNQNRHELSDSENDERIQTDALLEWDAKQFCIQLESRLRASQPLIRFSAVTS